MAAQKDRRIVKEDALLIIPSMAKVLGLRDAIILQQIHYFLQIAAENQSNYKEGYYWTYNSVKQWQEQFPWWNSDTIKRGLKSLEEKGIIKVGCYNKLPIDRTKWYRIDYEAACRFMQNALMELCKMHQCDLCNLHSPLPNNSLPDTSSNNKPIIYSHVSIFEHWNSKDIIKHKKLNEKLKRKINTTLKDYEEEEIKQAISTYAEILKSDSYYFTYSYTLLDFLTKGLDKFMDREVALQNYLNKDQPKKKDNEQLQKLAEKFGPDILDDSREEKEQSEISKNLPKRWRDALAD